MNLPRSASAAWPHDPLAADLAELRRLVRDRRVCVLTGAGLSTDSGIPDYRSPHRPPRKRPPIQHREFVQNAEMRQRYWARSALGWPRFRAFEPNAGHRMLARWEQLGALTPLLTQNVDRLHAKAGHEHVVELHGALERVQCLVCHTVSDRDDLQARFEHDNGAMLGAQYTVLPDGDVDLPDAAVHDFVVPACERCAGILMPDVVFFGGNVPKPRVEAAFAALDAADVLLVVGSSLTVFSGYRFVLRAVANDKPVAIVNRGPTRGDAHATVRLDASAADVLTALVAPG